ncbi:TPA: DUF927 domain-containing protein [Pasteurella multocida]|uniref:DUF927 domain-containing protein n=1 Tax=Pasteurella multocida TaxID=747 RepID=UPI0028E098DF|nr:DUF927 domain-containing protein [Pasteurella multocida]MEB3477775.1 DUF927 domain-containing protein [Pasteurella multocida]WNY75700.1 DUF927 domain-containing protein [Pasteurella multocida]HDR0629421.1 DUF927 domain-containing protein [Pasteurella multocida]HDR1115981.1 DUF927 domain-containing protein [Pasteurella multocida]HDR1129817.1 DUF927 domain-containing protein [Pasteurella multocida]
MSKLTKAPHFDQQPKDFMSDLIVLVGQSAWNAWNKGKGEEWLLLCQALQHNPKQKPIILGKEQLENISQIRIAHPEQQYIRLIQFGELSREEMTALCLSIAKNTKAKIIELCDMLGQHKENLSNHIKRIREGESVAEIVSESITEVHKENNQANTLPFIEERTERGKRGLYRITLKTNSSTGEIYEDKIEWLCDAVEVVGMGQSEDEFYTMLRFTPNRSEQSKIIALPLKDVGERTGWQLLRKNGLNITNNQRLRPYLADYLQDYYQKGFYRVVNATGWQSGAYILPNGEVIGEPKTPVFFVGQSANNKGYGVSGSIESWQQEIASNVAGNPFMMLGVAVALSAPIIHLINAESFGVHIFGGSSTGKTTIANIASSIYGHPDEIRLSWLTTPLGISNEAQARNDGFMPLDEIGQSTNRKHVGDIAYSLFNGVGKIQGAKEGGNRDLARWRTVAFSTGEIDLETYLTNVGIKTNVGQLVRLLNIPLQRATQFHHHKDGKAHADHLNQASKLHYGVIGREWIKHLIDLHRNNAIEPLYRAILENRLNTLPNDCHSQVKRVMSRFSILEMTLKLSLDFTGWDVGECENAITKAFNEWVNIFGYHSREELQVIEQVNGWLLANAEGRFIRYPIDPTQREVNNIAGYRVIPDSKSDEQEYFYLYPMAFDEAIKGHPKKQACQILAEKGMLKRGKEKGYGFTIKLPRQIKGDRTRCYLLYTLVESEEEENT